ncbi:MAG: polysaccharide deacetylase [Candidatus Rokuibacteriota bacterium]|nr:MAG: polysaccharide deacetylase [Candidatus Rokubacteria bacterium]
MRLPPERFDYSPISARRPWKLPRNARIAVWTIVNVEFWDIENPMARQVIAAPQGVVTIPDVPNWAWHEYGMRVGFWRLYDALRKRKIRATTSINARVCEAYPAVARAMLDAGWEFMGHGVVQGAMHTLPDQRDAIRTSVRMLRDFTGKPPKGWMGPGLSETWETLDLLAEEGIEYVADWVADDQPYEIRTTGANLVSVPYTLELNDIPMMIIQHHAAGEWLQRAKDSFDRLYAEGRTNPRVMALAVHPYISGVPHRIRYFEAVYDYIAKRKGVWLTTGEEIYEWYRTQR